MKQINPKYLLLIERVKEKHPELRELVEELREWCFCSDFYSDLFKVTKKDRIEIIKENVGLWSCKIIWQLDLYILSRALESSNYCIFWWELICCDVFSNDVNPAIIPKNINPPHWNISEYPDELLEKLYNLI